MLVTEDHDDDVRINTTSNVVKRWPREYIDTLTRGRFNDRQVLFLTQLQSSSEHSISTSASRYSSTSIRIDRARLRNSNAIKKLGIELNGISTYIFILYILCTRLY